MSYFTGLKFRVDPECVFEDSAEGWNEPAMGRNYIAAPDILESLVYITRILLINSGTWGGTLLFVYKYM